MQKRLLIVSNRLPLTIEKKETGYALRQSSGGLISAVEAYLNGGGKQVFSERIWAGVPGCDTQTWETVKMEQEPSDYTFLPVFTKDEEPIKNTTMVFPIPISGLSFAAYNLNTPFLVVSLLDFIYTQTKNQVI